MAANQESSVVGQLVVEILEAAGKSSLPRASRSRGPENDFQTILRRDYARALDAHFSKREMRAIVMALEVTMPGLNRDSFTPKPVHDLEKLASILGADFRADAFAGPEGLAVLGFYAKKRGRPLICVNSAHHPAAVAAAFLHEAGHHLTSRLFDMSQEPVEPLFGQDFNSHFDDPMEAHRRHGGQSRRLRTAGGKVAGRESRASAADDKRKLVHRSSLLEDPDASAKTGGIRFRNRDSAERKSSLSRRNDSLRQAAIGPVGPLRLMIRNALGQLVKKRRTAMALSQRQLAEQLGIQASHVAYIERGVRKPSLSLLGRMAEALGLDGAKLFFSCIRSPRRCLGSASSPSVPNRLTSHGDNSSATVLCSSSTASRALNSGS